MIAFRGVTKRYGDVTAVDGLDLAVADREIFGLIGPDGAGKTTSLRMLLGLARRDDGDIDLMGSADPGPVKGCIGYVPQRFSLYGDLTAMENLRLAGRLYGLGGCGLSERSDEALGLVGLAPFADRRAKFLSGGMKQKLALAAAILHRPKLVVLDEPTTGVDPVSRREFWRILYQLNGEGATVFVTTPYMDEAELCSRVAFMHRGRIAAVGPPARLKADYPYAIIEVTLARRDLRPLLAGCPVVDVNAFGDRHHLVVANPETAFPLVRAALERQPEPFKLARVEPTLEDVYVAMAREHDENRMEKAPV